MRRLFHDIDYCLTQEARPLALADLLSILVALAVCLMFGRFVLPAICEDGREGRIFALCATAAIVPGPVLVPAPRAPLHRTPHKDTSHLFACSTSVRFDDTFPFLSGFRSDSSSLPAFRHSARILIA